MFWLATHLKHFLSLGKIQLRCGTSLAFKAHVKMESVQDATKFLGELQFTMNCSPNSCRVSWSYPLPREASITSRSIALTTLESWCESKKFSALFPQKLTRKTSSCILVLLRCTMCIFFFPFPGVLWPDTAQDESVSTPPLQRPTTLGALLRKSTNLWCQNRQNGGIDVLMSHHKYSYLHRNLDYDLPQGSTHFLSTKLTKQHLKEIHWASMRWLESYILGVLKMAFLSLHSLQKALKVSQYLYFWLPGFVDQKEHNSVEIDDTWNLRDFTVGSSYASLIRRSMAFL